MYSSSVRVMTGSSLQTAQMLVEKVIRDGDAPAIPLRPASRLVFGEEEDRPTVRVECEQDAEFGSPGRTGAELLHILVARSDDAVDQRSAELWTEVAQDAQCRDHLFA